MAYIKETISHNIHFLKKQELTFININFTLNLKEYSVITVYRPPSSNVDFFLTDLEMIFKENLNKMATTIFAGDININIRNLNVPKVNEYLNIMYEFGFISYLELATREDSCLDHYFIKFPNNVQCKHEFIVLSYHITDHYPVFLSISDLNEIKDDRKIIIRKSINYNTLKDKIKEEEESWQDIFCNDSVNEDFYI